MYGDEGAPVGLAESRGSDVSVGGGAEDVFRMDDDDVGGGGVDVAAEARRRYGDAGGEDPFGAPFMHAGGGSEDIELLGGGADTTDIFASAAQSEGVKRSRTALSDFLSRNRCIHLLPESTKIVVLDLDLPVFSAFRALHENQLKSAPVWDSEAQNFTGMITVSDFIGILAHLRQENAHAAFSQTQILETLKSHKIRDWRTILRGKDDHHTPEALIYASSDDTLYECARQLLRHRIHRLPIMDETTHSILYIATHYNVLHHTLSLLPDGLLLLPLPLACVSRFLSFLGGLFFISPPSSPPPPFFADFVIKNR
jgi:CBS domain-containing protein